jgi:hypothetical protein
VNDRVINLRRIPAYQRDGLSRKRPEDLKELLAWEDAWRSLLLDLAAKMASGNQSMFQAAAAVVLAGYLANYDG